MKRLFLFLPLIFAAGCQIVPTEEDRALAEQFDYDYYLAGKSPNPDGSGRPGVVGPRCRRRVVSGTRWKVRP